MKFYCDNYNFNMSFSLVIKGIYFLNLVRVTRTKAEDLQLQISVSYTQKTKIMLKQILRLNIFNHV